MSITLDSLLIPSFTTTFSAWLWARVLILPPRRNMTSERYIAAEDNIELVRDPDLIADHEFFYAGKFFKRFDRENCRFVSNIREQFPDD